MTNQHSKPTLVTGAAGFIGYHLAERLLNDDHHVIGLDNLNDYYDPALKEARLERLQARDDFTTARIDLADRRKMEALFVRSDAEAVSSKLNRRFAGVRYVSDAKNDLPSVPCPVRYN